MNYEITIQVYERGTLNKICQGSANDFESAAEQLGKLERFINRVDIARQQEENAKEIPL